MGVSVDLRVLELLSSRLCHELISPVGAINNGIELMDEDDPDFVKEATQLIGKSARTAGNRLNFYRFAYGSARAGSGREVATGLLDGSKVGCVWNDTASSLPVEWQRLACNMVVLAAEALPRGGSVEIAALPGATGAGVNVAAAGNPATLSDELRTVLDAKLAIDDLTARNVHAYYTARLADAVGARLTVAAPQEGSLVFTAAS